MESEVKAESEVRPRRAGLDRPAADSVERALDQIGDRWTFLLLREAFFGVHRFDDFQERTGASPAVLADRLKKLVANGLFAKHAYSAHANRFEYRLTQKGLDLYPITVLVMEWGDRWLAGPAGPPLTLIHECGHSGRHSLRCDGCGKPVEAHATTWTPGSRRRRSAR